MSHPTSENLTISEFLAWANCSVPDCGNKVAHNSDKCFPHTHGWEAVRDNLRRQIEAPEQFDAEWIAWCKAELERIKHYR